MPCNLAALQLLGQSSSWAQKKVSKKESTLCGPRDLELRVGAWPWWRVGINSHDPSPRIGQGDCYDFSGLGGSLMEPKNSSLQIWWCHKRRTSVQWEVEYLSSQKREGTNHQSIEPSPGTLSSKIRVSLLPEWQTHTQWDQEWNTSKHLLPHYLAPRLFHWVVEYLLVSGKLSAVGAYSNDSRGQSTRACKNTPHLHRYTLHARVLYNRRGKELNRWALCTTVPTSPTPQTSSCVYEKFTGIFVKVHATKWEESIKLKKWISLSTSVDLHNSIVS